MSQQICVSLPVRTGEADRAVQQYLWGCANAVEAHKATGSLPETSFLESSCSGREWDLALSLHPESDEVGSPTGPG